MGALGEYEPGHEPGGGPLTRLIAAIERAAHAGWPETARLIALLMVVAGAVALVVLAGRWR